MNTTVGSPFRWVGKRKCVDRNLSSFFLSPRQCLSRLWQEALRRLAYDGGVFQQCLLRHRLLQYIAANSLVEPVFTGRCRHYLSVLLTMSHEVHRSMDALYPLCISHDDRNKTSLASDDYHHEHAMEISFVHGERMSPRRSPRVQRFSLVIFAPILKIGD